MTPEQPSLLVSDPAHEALRPLADRMRPATLDQFFGQSHLLGETSTLRQALENDRLHSMVFWGPPGTGKTTLARMIAHHCGAVFISLSAVLSGVKDIRNAVDRARQARDYNGERTVLFSGWPPGSPTSLTPIVTKLS